MMELTANSTISTPTHAKFFYKDVKWLGGRHDGYPLSSFRDYMRIRKQHSAESSPMDYAALRQSHLTFGFLEAVMEQKIPESDLLFELPMGGVVMSSRNILFLLRQWRHRIKTLRISDADAHKEWFGRVQTTLEQARGILMIEVRKPSYSPFRGIGLQDDVIAGILYGVAALGEAISLTKWQFMIQSKGVEWSFITPVVRYHRDMVTGGWCPSTARMVGQEISMLGYASTRGPYIRQDAGGQKHNRCSPKAACVLNSIDMDSYYIRHTSNTCNCSFSKPVLGIVVEALSQGCIPVVTIEEHDASYEIKCTCASDKPYVAISHVWADGLGSTTEVGLPTCQLQRLATVTRRLVPGGAFWMDGLCIPGRKDMRVRAIGLMADTYKNATAVLVVDSGIRSCSFNIPEEERLLRVRSSAWIQRLWTLQEALLASKLVFEFSDKLATIEDLIPSEEDLQDVLKTQLTAEIFRLSTYQKYRQLGPQGFGLGHVARSLRWRTTSKLEDETLAIASLLNVDVSELVNLPPERRMMTLLLRVHRLPSNIVFLSGNKLEEPGFRWAPQSLMVREGNQLGTTDYNAQCTPEGLLAEYASILFEVTTFEKGERWFLRDPSDGQFYSVLDLSPETSNADPVTESYTCSGTLLALGAVS